ncbi:MFS transporter [Streptomyces sp. NPDC050085]|uniref:MFS transporter n=1 Tax=Streptomyces sp. NPDC050085 TaxID=3365600 RepID=UPI0037A8CEDA
MKESEGFGLRAWLILVTLAGATFMTGLDYSIVMVALPEIGRDLGFGSASGLQWVATACLLPTAGLLPLFGRLSDLLGRRRLFVTGTFLFTALSLVAAAAVSPGMLIAARAGQGVAAAMIAPTAIALMTAAFPEGPQRTRALAVNGALLSLGFVVGTIGGGVITSGLNWRWTMALLVALGSVVLTGALTVLPKQGDVRRASRLDVPGAALSGAGLFALVYAISTGAQAGWGSLPTVGSLLVAVVALAGFFLVEARHPAPLVPLGLLKRRTVKWSFLVGMVTYGMGGGATLILTLYMQDVLGWSPLETGFGFLGEGGAAFVAGFLASRIIARRGTAGALAVGLAVQAAGTGAMFLLPGHANLVLLLVTSGAMGFGHVLSVVAFVATITSGLSAEEQGVGGSLAQMPLYVGAIGTAVLAAIASSTGGSALGGMHHAFLAAGLIAAAGVPVAALLLRRR